MEGTMNGRTKHLVLSISLVTCSLLLAAVAVAQVTTPPPAESPGAQLQRVPVSDLHIGPPSASMQNPYAGDKNAWVEGKALFTSLNCVGCHAPGGGGGMGPALSDKVWIYGSEPGQLYLTIAHGRPNGMPQWGTALPPQAIWALVTYVQSLSVDNPVFGSKTPRAGQAAPGSEPLPPKPPAAKQPPPLPAHPRPVPQTPKSTHPAPPTYPQPASTAGGHA
jgi:cytochrome c oxidase cbb3-type subunit 3